MRKIKEHNNRAIAKQNAEYITGQELRLYLADKVKKYLGEGELTVFDGAVGSGQLEQYINISKLYGVDIQEMSVETARENYENSDIECKSFFEYNREDFIADVVIMNPPFSIGFKALSETEQTNIKAEFSWKKSGKVDDIFLLKSLKYTKRFAFYIMFPGLAYRADMAKMRELIGNQLVEFNMIENAFEDTGINVIFLVIDKEKTTDELSQEIYNCKQKKVLHSNTAKIVPNENWETPRVQVEEEVIDIDNLNNEIEIQYKKHILTGIEMSNEFKKLEGKNYRKEFEVIKCMISEVDGLDFDNEREFQEGMRRIRKKYVGGEVY